MIVPITDYRPTLAAFIAIPHANDMSKRLKCRGSMSRRPLPFMLRTFRSLLSVRGASYSLAFELQEASFSRDACACVGSTSQCQKFVSAAGAAGICAPVVPARRCNLIVTTERWHAASRLLQASRILAPRLASHTNKMVLGILGKKGLTAHYFYCFR